MFKILNQLNLTKLFILAILLRVLIMPFYFHPDIKTYNFQSSFLNTGVFNIYSYLIDNKEKLPIREEFVYFPLTYFFIGGYQIIVSPVLGSNFPSWLSDASAEAVSRVGVFRYLFILKLPFLILDLIIPFLLIKFFNSDITKRKAFILWLFNPFSLVLIYFFSNVDIIPVILSLASLLLFQQKRLILAALILGLAIGFKPFPLLGLPFLLIFIPDIKKIILFLGTVFLTVLFIILPFFSQAFIHSALVSNLTTRLAFPSIGIGFGEALMIGVIPIIILFLSGSLEKNKKVEFAWYYLFACFLLMFSSIHYHVQWLLWIIPFIVLFELYSNLRKLVWIWLVLATIIPLLYDDKSMTISLLSVISPFYNLLPTPFLIMERLYDPYLVQGVLHSVMFAFAVVIVWKSFKLIEHE